MYTVARHGTLIAALFASSLAVTGCKRQEPTPAPQAAAEPASPVTADAKAAANQIAADYLRDQITTFSSDAFEGRGPATPGDTKARDYLIEQLKQIGFEPGGADGGWQQTFDVVGVDAQMPKQWSFKKRSEEHTSELQSPI